MSDATGSLRGLALDGPLPATPVEPEPAAPLADAPPTAAASDSIQQAWTQPFWSTHVLPLLPSPYQPPAWGSQDVSLPPSPTPEWPIVPVAVPVAPTAGSSFVDTDGRRWTYIVAYGQNTGGGQWVQV